MQNGQPLSEKKKVRILVALTILAWATQTLLHQWGYGQTVSRQPEQRPELGEEKFVPQTGVAFGTPIELRADAAITGNDIKFRQLFRWSSADSALFNSMADLTLLKLSPNVTYQTFTLDDLKEALKDAKINLAMLKFSGATSCRVSRSDVTFNERVALEQWLDQKPVTGISPPAAPATTLAPKRSEQPVITPVVQQDSAPKSLKQLIQLDLAQRLNLPSENLELTFDAKDDRILNLSEPMFKFTLNARRKSLGTIPYDVTIATASGSQKLSVTAEARAWQNQVFAAKPISLKQVIRDEDLTTRRILLDKLPDAAPVSAEQLVGQQATQDINVGAAFTGRLVESVPMVKPGQLVTIQLTQGTVQLTNVARAIEVGTYGQTIKVRNDVTKEIFEVVITGPQTANLSGTRVASSR